MLCLLAGLGTGAMAQTTINGAGATFPYPIYSKWFSEYRKQHPDVQINYQSIGSGGGIKQVTEGTVDFGASDAPLADDKLREMPHPVIHFPTVGGAVVLAYNLPGLKQPLRLTTDALIAIYTGRVTKWNDARIAAANVGVTLPKGVSRLRLAMSVNSTAAGLPGGISPVLRWTQK